MFDYPPREFLLNDAVFVLLLSLPLVLIAGLLIFRPWRNPRPQEPFVWLAVSVLIWLLTIRLAGKWTFSESSANSEIADERFLAMRVHWIATGSILVGMLVCVIRNLWSGRFLIGSVLCVAVSGFMFLSALIPLGEHSRDMARTSQCRNNMKQLFLALRSYQNTYSALPSAVSGNPPVSWRVLLLPMLDHQETFDLYQQSFAWDAPENRRIASFPVVPYLCPTLDHHHDGESINFTSYSVPIGTHSLFDATRTPRLDQISDGASHTLLLLEVCGTRIGWSEPRDIDISQAPIGVNLPGDERRVSPGVLSSPHLGNGANAAFADGTIRYFSQGTDPTVLKSILQCDDGGPGIIEF